MASCHVRGIVPLRHHAARCAELPRCPAAPLGRQRLPIPTLTPHPRARISPGIAFLSLSAGTDLLLLPSGVRFTGFRWDERIRHGWQDVLVTVSDGGLRRGLSNRGEPTISDSIMTAGTAGTAQETVSKMCAVPAPTVLSHIEAPQHMPLADARELTKVFLYDLTLRRRGYASTSVCATPPIEFRVARSSPRWPSPTSRVRSSGSPARQPGRSTHPGVCSEELSLSQMHVSPSSPASAHTCEKQFWPPPDCTAPQLLGAARRLTPYEPAWARCSASDGPP